SVTPPCADTTADAAPSTLYLLPGQSSSVRHGRRRRPCATVRGCVVPTGPGRVMSPDRRGTGGGRGRAPVPLGREAVGECLHELDDLVFLLLGQAQVPDRRVLVGCDLRGRPA